MRLELEISQHPRQPWRDRVTANGYIVGTVERLDHRRIKIGQGGVGRADEAVVIDIAVEIDEAQIRRALGGS